MHRKHYIEAAARLAQMDDREAAAVICAFLSNFFADDNSRFDETRFRYASGVDPKELERGCRRINNLW